VICGLLSHSLSLSGTIFETVSRSNGCVLGLLYSRPLGRSKKTEFNWSLLMLLNVTGNTECLQGVHLEANSEVSPHIIVGQATCRISRCMSPNRLF
jgi:hypothetical protein